MFVQVIDFLLTAQRHIAGKGNNFYPRSQYQESHIKTDLVVTRTG